jgi:hypothetical protein
MSEDIRNKKGQFIAGNPGGALKQPAESKIEVLTDVSELQDDVATLRRSGYKRILQKFKNMSQMDLAEFERRAGHKDKLNIEDLAFMQFFKKMVEQGDVNRMRFYFATYGIPTELKAIAVQDLDGVMNKNIQDQQYDVELSDEETILMLDKMKEIKLRKIKENK